MALVMKKTCYRLFIGLVAIAALLIYHPSFGMAETNPSELAQLAFDFQVGDLRGMYSVFISDLQAALQTDN